MFAERVVRVETRGPERWAKRGEHGDGKQQQCHGCDGLNVQGGRPIRPFCEQPNQQNRGGGYGNGRKSTASTIEKTDVAAPRPIADVVTAIRVKAGLLRKLRSAWRMSRRKLFMPYSPLNATAGSIEDARVAGSRLAANAARSMASAEYPMDAIGLAKAAAVSRRRR